MKRLKLIVIVISILTFTLFLGSIYAGELNLNSLKFNVLLNEDGSMNVTEIWDISIKDTNTLYKTFPLDSEGFDGFSNATVYEILENGEKIPFARTNKEVYHVEKGAYYSLINSKSDYEIAWGVSINGRDTKRYEINYTVDNIIHKYNDCAELYWQFIGKSFEIDADFVDGTVILPQNNYTKEDIKVWAHGQLNGNINIISNNEIKFEVSNFKAGEMLEVRIAMPTSLFPSSNKIISVAKLDSIIEEETIWANEANEERQRTENIEKMIDLIVKGFCIFSIIFFLIKLVKYIGIMKKTPKLVPDIKLDYYREIPGGDDALPTDAAFLQGYMESNIPNIVSSMMLDLALKKALAFEIIDKTPSKQEITVKLLLEDSNKLKIEEKILYDYLEKVVKKENSFTMKDLEKYIEKHITSFNKMTNNIIEETKNTQVKKGIFDLEINKVHSKNIGISILYFVLAIFTLFASIMLSSLYSRAYLLIIPLVLFIILFIVTLNVAQRYNGVTQEGVNQKERWNGLKKYMKDFSLLDEKEIPALVMWERYLVYATVFGIAEKVLKQLKLKYPELSDEGALTGTTYMYLMYSTGINRSLISSINNSISSSYASGNYSSGSGSGGGFSGGGRRRLWWWRPEVVVNIE